MGAFDAPWLGWPVVALLLVAAISSELWTWGLKGAVAVAGLMLAVVAVAFLAERLS